MSADVTPRRSLRLDDDERARMEQDGYVVRGGLFGAGEVADMATASDALCARLVASRAGAERHRAGSYVYDADPTAGVILKLEGTSDVLHGIEPFAHLSHELESWAYDDRFVEPMKDIVGDDEPILFTEKFNLKSARVGGENILHQDHPYWAPISEDAASIATAVLMLDDASVENGCLEVAPGSHLRGSWPTRQDPGHEREMVVPEDLELVPIEASAGSVLFFGAYLVHHSSRNTSATGRRALLFSYQPHGRAHILEYLRRTRLAARQGEAG